MPDIDFKSIFTDSFLENLFPKNLADRFFEALFGDVFEGAYDISLKFKNAVDNQLEFQFHLTQRPGKCLACTLTYGLPQVFSKHPIINVKGLVKEIANKLNNKVIFIDWKLWPTIKISHELHIIPLKITMES